MPTDSDYRSRIKLRLEHNLKKIEDARRLSEVSLTIDGSKSSNDRARPSELQPPININDKERILGLFEDNIVIKINDVPITMSMSFVTGLTDLIEDEVVPKPIPIKVGEMFFHFFLF